ELEESRKYKTEFAGEDGVSLVITEATIDDGGTYLVRADNRKGSVTSTTKLIVHSIDDVGLSTKDDTEETLSKKPRRQRQTGKDQTDNKNTIKLTKPEFLLRLRNKTAKVDDVAKLSVKVEGDPVPSITWYKDDEEITQESGDGKYEIFNEGNIYNLEVYDTDIG
ncbi:unnamed protein product, partial [Owenia fusiformis]